MPPERRVEAATRPTAHGWSTSTTVTGGGKEVESDCLAGGGNMGALMRTFDWPATPLGPVTVWPQSLRTAVSIMLASGFPMLVLWGENYIQLYNDAYRPVLGDTKHPGALGQKAADCWPEIWDDVLRPMFGRVMSGGEPIWNEDLLFVLDRNGYLEETFFTFSYSAIRDESSRPGGVLVTCVETTDRVIGERRLRTLRELAAHGSSSQDVEQACAAMARTISGNAHDLPFALLYLVDGDVARLCATAGLDAGTEASPRTIPLDGTGAAGTWPLAEVAKEGQARVIEHLEPAGASLPGGPWPEPARTAVILPIAPSVYAPVLGLLVAGVSPRRELDAGYLAFLDLVAAHTASVLGAAGAHEAERKRAEALAEIDRVKTAFFSNVSHEFRTPLTLLLAPVEAALGSSGGTLGGADLAAVHRNALRLLKLVNTLLDFSRIEAGRMQACYRETDIAALTADLASGFRSLVEGADLTLDVDCQPVAGPVFVDREMWEKIVLNLLSNAYKFTFGGGIRVALAQRDGQVQLTIADSGVGIPEGDLPHVFERFHRARGTRSRSYEGTGIGLALVAELARLHGGGVRVQSREGEGSSFTVTIPTGRAHLPADRIDPTPSPPARPAALSAFLEEAGQWHPAADAAPERSPEDEGARVLVVDDNADMREYLRRLLAPRWAVEVVEGGERALTAIRSRRPDLVLSDVMMPGIDGFELVARLRADPLTAGIPIILLSGRAGEEARIEGVSAGADDYLVKPFSARELIARVSTQIELSRLRLRVASEYARLHQLFDVAPAAMALLRGPDHVYEMANELYIKVIGNRDIVGKPGREALPELSDQGVWDLMDRVYASGEAYQGREFQVLLDRRGDGTLDPAYFDFVWQPIADGRGGVEAILVHAVEVTTQVRARREVDAARQAAEAASRAKDEFLAMLGHELRNPLAPILTALQLIALRGDARGMREMAVIDRQVRHLVRLVDDLLDVSRIARGKIELQRVPVEIGTVVARAIEMASPILEEREHVLVVDVPREALTVLGDVTRLAQVVMNLLTNAAKYTERHGRIEIRARRDGGNVELAVRDNGIGIDADILPAVFDLFVQARQSIDRSQGGLGLGLTIVKSLVTLHGGSVEARSAGPRQGSEFVVRLPAAVVQDAPAQARPEQPAARARGATRLRVLVVDDNRDAAQLMAQALAFIGHDARVAWDGPTALAAAAGFDPDVALLDLGLPVMDGYELASKLRPESGGRPVLVAVTGYGQDSDRRRSRAAGFVAHVVKPVDLEALRRLLRRVARKQREA